MNNLENMKSKELLELAKKSKKKWEKNNYKFNLRSGKKFLGSLKHDLYENLAADEDFLYDNYPKDMKDLFHFTKEESEIFLKTL